jgi:N-acetylglucosaminyldiphosphoundecaprenol N-acetyl-beta-D-mannosaminyltransferase
VLSRNLICTNPSEFFEARVVTFLNPYSFLQIHQSNVDLNQFDKICIDGIALKIFLDKVFGGTNIERMSFDFTSVAHLVFENAASESQLGFILGSDPDSNAAFLSKICEMFPGIKLDGRSGYFDDDAALNDCINTLASSDHDFVVIGMGAVKQEEVAIKLKESGFKGRIYTCGGFIHQTALSDGEYYPVWVDKLNLRFAYRMVKEPTTIKRYLLDYPKSFILLTRNIKKFEH